MLAVIVIAAVALAIYVAPILAIVVAIVTKADANAGVKAVVLTVLAGITAVVAPAVQNGSDLALDSKTLGAFVVVMIAAVAAHFGVLKPLGITGQDGAVARKTAGFGIG